MKNIKNLSKFGVSELNYSESLNIDGGDFIYDYAHWVFSFYKGVWDGLNGNCTMHECD